MAVETTASVATVGDLVTGWPVGQDDISELGDHLRILKYALKQSFPKLDSEVSFSGGDTVVLFGITDEIANGSLSAGDLKQVSDISATIYETLKLVMPETLHRQYAHPPYIASSYVMGSNMWFFPAEVSEIQSINQAAIGLSATGQASTWRMAFASTASIAQGPDLSAGWRSWFYNTSLGAPISLSAKPGVTILSKGLVLKKGGTARFMFLGSDTWYLSGDLE